LFLLALLSAAPSLRAADIPRDLPSEEDVFGEVPSLVSATRLDQPVTDAPVSVTVIDREMIEAYNPTELVDVLRLVPGIQIGHEKGNRFAVTYHGLSDEYSRRFQVLIDGRSVYSPGFDQVEWIDIPLAVEDIERIEVIRGPNAASYGANAVAAIINIITLHPADARGHYAKTTISDSDFDRRSILYRYGGSAGNLDYRATIAYTKDKGFPPGTDHTHFDNKRIGMAYMAGDYWINPRDQLTFQAGFNKADHQRGFSDELEVEPERTRRGSSNYQQIRWRRQLGDKEDFSIQFYRNYFREKDDFHTALISEIDPVLAAALEAIAGIPDQRLPVMQSYVAERYDLEYQHSRIFTDKLRAVWGASARLDRVGGAGFLGRGSHHDYLYRHTYRLFSHAEWRFASKWLLNAGLMVEHNSATDTDISPRLALNYQHDRNHTFRASFSRALRTPSVFELNADYWIGTMDGIPLDDLYKQNDRPLDPEEMMSYEIAWLGSFPRYRLNVDVKLFLEKQRDLIAEVELDSYLDPFNALIGTSIDGEVKYYDNAGWSTSKGIELQIDWRPTEHTRVHAGYTYIDRDGRLLKEIDPSHPVPAEYYRTSDLIPEHTGTLLVTHKLTPRDQFSLAYHVVSPMSFIGGDKYEDTISILRIGYSHLFKVGSSDIRLRLLSESPFDTYYDYENHAGDFEPRAFASVEVRLP